MPELPEVETIARSLRSELIGRSIVEAEVRWPRTIAAPSVRKFKLQIQGQVVQRVGRRAKFLHLQLSPLNLLIHLRMSGDLRIEKGRIKPQKHDRLILRLAEPTPMEPSAEAARNVREPISLVLNDTRKFGRVWLTVDMEQVTGDLGPEPLSRGFTAQRFYDRLHSHHRLLKPLLLDQKFLAGLGNIYTDEALHMAKLHPLKHADSVTAVQATRLHAAIRSILNEGIRRNGASIDWVYRGGDFQNHFRVYDRAGKPCPVCGTTIERLVVGQRGTHVCPHCQRV
jgi:formamidopyrimidine-DNA glycosylase